MAQDEERLTDSSPTINTVTISNELPAKPFRISIELPLFLVMGGIALSGAAISNIILYRACVHALDYSKEECQIFLSLEKNNQTHLENEVQKYVTNLSTVKSIIDALIPAVLSLFLGVWSDTHGRKPLIVWPLFGLSMSSILLVVYCMIDSLGPWWYILTIVPYSLCGGFTIFFTGAFCLISDITSAENRSLRMTIMEAAISVGSIVGGLASPHVLRMVGNTWLILIATSLNVLAYAYSNIYIRESLTGAIEGGLSTVLDFLLVKEMVRECFKRRPNFGRAQLLLLTLANCLAILIMYGLMPLEYMFTREQLHWTLSDYTLFGAVSTSISFFGAFIGIVLLQKLMRFSDLVTANIANVSTLAEHIIRVVAFKSWHMYLGAGISVFKGLSSPLIRSFITKILPLEDIAKAFALMSALEGLCPLLAPLMYNSLYYCTITVFPAAIYVLSSGITVICVILLGIQIMLFQTAYFLHDWRSRKGGCVQYFRWNLSSQYQVLGSH